jgi:hypothetical protein
MLLMYLPLVIYSASMQMFLDGLQTPAPPARANATPDRRTNDNAALALRRTQSERSLRALVKSRQPSRLK